MIIILFILVFITHNNIVASKLYGVNATIIIFVLYCIVLYHHYDFSCSHYNYFNFKLFFLNTLIFGHFKTFFWIFNNIVGVSL